MKKSVVFLMLVLLLCTSVSFGNKFKEINTVELKDVINGEMDTYIPVSLMLKGKDVISDVPGILYNLDGNNRTLVPVRFVTESLGAEVSWIGETKTAKIEFDGKVIDLQIDNPYAMVDGTEQALPDLVPPKLMSYGDKTRTMIPIRFISETFGLDIDWIGETKTVTINAPEQSIKGLSFNYTTKFPEIRLDTTGYIDYIAYEINADDTLDIKNKLIFSFPNTRISSDGFNEEDYYGFLTKEGQEIFYDTGDIFNIKNLKISPKQNVPNTTDLIFNLSGKKGYDAFYEEETGEFVIRFINSVKSIETKSVYNSEAVIISTEEDNPAINLPQTQNKHVKILDIVNSTLRISEKERIINKGGIKKISYSQLDTTQDATYEADDQVTRVTLELDANKSADDVYIDPQKNEIFMYVSGNPLNGFEYVKKNQEKSILNINFLNQGVYDYIYDKRNNIVELSFDKSLVDINKMDLKIEDHIVDRINITTSGDKYYIKFLLDKDVKPTALTNEGQMTETIALNFKNTVISNSVFKNKLVVVDAGHGGHDPGASNEGYTEKWLNLRVAKALEKKLKAQGFKVYMTREVDEYIGLYDRPNIANELGADAFVSIHFNAALNQAAKGVEVLYNDDSLRNNKAFARTTQDYLVDILNRVDRGIVSRPELVVIRETHMDAILVELGFMTNPEELNLIIKDSYIEKAADALMRGVMDQLK